MPNTIMDKCFVNIFAILWLINNVMAQDEPVCYGPGSIAVSVILTLILGGLLAVCTYFFWKKYWRERKARHLILETDPEKGKGQYAFDNPGFKDAGLTPIGKAIEKNKLENGHKTKWSPLGVLSNKNEKRKTLDDSALNDLVKVVTLRSHDFTGLGFNICGNMKEGIYIKDILHRGPASESGKLSAGDRINSITINFEHMVYEDALAILSYASPYEIVVSARNGKTVNFPGQGARPTHPTYKSSSCLDLSQIGKSAKKCLFQPDNSSEIGSNYSSLQKSRSNVTTLERGNAAASPKTSQTKTSKSKLNNEQLKNQLEQNMVQDHKETMRLKNEYNQNLKIDTEMQQKTENKHMKFGVQVLPMEKKDQKSPKITEVSNNDNNINLEKCEVVPAMSIDEVDLKTAPPEVKKREKIAPKTTDDAQAFVREGSMNNSGIRRDENNIPLEMPNTMLNAAMAARKNRKPSEEEDLKSPKKLKGKAPAPPEMLKAVDINKNKFDEICKAEEAEIETKAKILTETDDDVEKIDTETANLTLKSDTKDYNSDSDMETDNQSSVNTIELNASDITVHQSEDSEDLQARKTASTGDLTKIQKGRKTSTGTLERAQSLDITDTTIPVLAKKRKAGKIEDNFDSKTSSDDSLYGKALINKEPRLSLILDGLTTFQRSRLKKSTEWGNLEDAILNIDRQEGSNESMERQSSSFEDFKLSAENLTKNFNFGAKSPEFDALVNKINEIKQETIDIINEQDRNIDKTIDDNITKEEICEISDDVPKTMETMAKTIEKMPKSIEAITVDTPTIEGIEVKKSKNQIWPFEESNKTEITYKPSEKFEIVFNNPVETEEDHSYTVNNNITIEETPQPNETVVSQTQVYHEPNAEDATESDEPPMQQNDVMNMAEINSFILAEREASTPFYNTYAMKLDDTNASDDIKVSMGSLERGKFEIKAETSPTNVSNITITDNHKPVTKYEISVNKTELKIEPMKENERKIEDLTYIKNFENINMTTPDLIKNITIAEALHDLNNEVTVEGPTSLTFEISSDGNIEFTDQIINSKPSVTTSSDDNKLEFKAHNGLQMKTNGDINKVEVPSENHSSLTYITEIQVITPNNNKNKNVSEIEINPKDESPIENLPNKDLDNDFENYIKNFESNIKNFENNIHSFEQNIQDVAQTAKKEVEKVNNTKSIIINKNNKDPEKELLKVQEIVEEQLKKLPEMRFTTSSYESQIKPPEKRQSQIEILRSNFEKSSSPPRHVRSETSPPKSRIPILNKTPPTSPERRDSRNLESEPDKEILEMMSSHIPSVSNLKYQPKTTSRNVTVTSIRSNSKIPSGLPTFSNRPPVPPRKSENNDNENLIHVTTNGNSESNFRQWVFNPSSESAVTNITVLEKYEHK